MTFSSWWIHKIKDLPSTPYSKTVKQNNDNENKTKKKEKVMFSTFLSAVLRLHLHAWHSDDSPWLDGGSGTEQLSLAGGCRRPTAGRWQAAGSPVEAVPLAGQQEFKTPIRATRSQLTHVSHTLTNHSRPISLTSQTAHNLTHFDLKTPAKRPVSYGTFMLLKPGGNVRTLFWYLAFISMAPLHKGECFVQKSWKLTKFGKSSCSSSNITWYRPLSMGSSISI